MTRKRTRLLNGRFDPVTLEDTLDWALDFIRREKRGWIYTLNVATLMTMRSDRDLCSFVRRSALIVADGQPLVWTSGWFGEKLPSRVTGIDLVTKLSKRAGQEGIGVYLLGAEQSVIEEARDKLEREAPQSIVLGAHHGYFSTEEEEALSLAIAQTGAKVLFVGMGVPRQERFIERNWDKLGVSLAIGVGGSFDVIAGRRSRAPEVFQRAGMEWMYRLVQEPRRLAKRYIVTNTQFIYHLACALLRPNSSTLSD